MVPDFKTVTAISHRSDKLLRRVWATCADGSSLPPPKKTGLPQRPENTPEALAGKLMWMTPEKLDNIEAVVDMSRSTYKALLPEAMELLSQIPKTQFRKADEARRNACWTTSELPSLVRRSASPNMRSHCTCSTMH
ncbi:hypothetical protein PHYBOEH_002357 [Phytophthora boehmeriae]|uniref:Uncharacterized protein n=1 Tax=Phytophthora boehmeriae TaxID=109152 RepID=A0A8T1XAV9_9STRA|nr:hypothetical protein PHYBOEH_002357 [Phytophthora boehmeriae]